MSLNFTTRENRFKKNVRKCFFFFFGKPIIWQRKFAAKRVPLTDEQVENTK